MLRQTIPPVSLISAHRRDWIDAARGVAIALVIVGHAIEPLFYNRADGAFSDLAFTIWRGIYAAHLPAFFLIAGLVRPPREIGQHGSPRSPLQLISLAFVWHLIGIGIVTALALAEPSPGHGLAEAGVVLVRPFVLGTGFSIPPLWFLLALAGVETVWGRVEGRWARIVAMAIALTLVSVFTPHDIANFWSFKALGPGLTFYAAGVALQRAPKRWFVWGLGACVLVWLAAAAANRGCDLPSAAWCAAEGMNGRFAVFMAIGRYGTYPLFLLAALAGSGAILGLGVLLSRSIFSPLLVWMGRRSLDLYLVNGLLMVIFNPLVRQAPLSGRDAVVVPVVIAVALVSQLILGSRAGSLVAATQRMAGRLSRALGAPVRLGPG